MKQLLAYQITGTTIISGETIYVIQTVGVDILTWNDADLNGKGFSYGDGKPSRNYVGGWKDKNQTIFWNFRNKYF